jgi:hypothetical protein
VKNNFKKSFARCCKYNKLAYLCLIKSLTTKAHTMTQQEIRSATLLWNKIKGAEQIIVHCENLTPMVISAIIELSIDASVSGDKYEKASSIALLRTALGKAAERIVVLENLLESERKLRQADRAFALKNATYL